MAIKLNSAQREATEYLEGPLLVLAGPGTGKTQLLSSKVAYILENTDANPENILCLTFTEAGATNMRNRLLSIIGRSANAVNIHTYHAFGSDLLARYKNYAEQPLRAYDAPIDTVMKFKIVQALREELPPEDILHSSITPTSSIIEVIDSAKAYRLTANDLAQITQANLEASIQLNQELGPILDAAPRSARYDKAVALIYRPLLEVLVKHISNQPIVKNIEPEVNVVARSLNDALEEAQTDPKHSVKPLSAWRDQHFEKDANGNFRLKNLVANKKLASVAKLMQAYGDYLRERGLYDFNDMIEESIQILKTDAGFRADLSERFQYILLDEFQDTNPSQYELVRLISDYESPCIMAVGDDDQAIYAFQGANASNLVDFQTQYNAKIINLSENYRSTAEILNLSKQIAEQITDSFAKKQGVDKTLTSVRNAEILAKYKQSIPSLYHILPEKSSMSNDDEEELVLEVDIDDSDAKKLALELNVNASDAGDLAQNRNKSDTKDYAAELTHIVRHEFISPDAEYYWVAQQIRMLIDAGANPSSIAVLAPYHRLILPIIPYLKEAGIDIAYEKRENILEDAQIKQLLTLAEFVFELAEERVPTHRLLEILSFSFWGCSALSVITTLQAIQQSKKSALKVLASSEDEQLARIAVFLADLVAVSYDAPLELFLDYLIGTAELNGFRSPYLDYYTHLDQESATDDATYATFELYNNLSVLREAIRAHTQSSKPTLRDLMVFLQDYRSAGATVLSTSPYQDSANSVQVMTAHKSKGLEFKHVFLIAVNDKDWGNASGNRNLIVLPKNLTQIRHAGDTENECLRLFFVAITRAELSLTMTNSVKSFTETNLARLRYLDEHENEQKVPISPYLPDPFICVHHENPTLARRETNLTTQWVSAYQKPLPELRPVLEKKLERYQLTASDLTSFIDIRYAGPMAFYRTKILGSPREPATAEIVLGNLIHATFEAITSQGLTDADALQFFAEKLADEPLTSKEAERLMIKGKRALEISLANFGELLRDANSKAEVNLYHEHLVLGGATPQNSLPEDAELALLSGTPITGKIDHIHFDDEAKTAEIYDFKTGTFHPKGWTSHDSLYRYSLQLGFYKLLLNLSPTYRKYTVTRGHILYVNPDSDGQVYDKVYEYNSDDEKFLRKLAEAVYWQVKTLNFVQDAELFVPADAERSVYDVKKFAEKVVDISKPR